MQAAALPAFLMITAEATCQAPRHLNTVLRTLSDSSTRRVQPSDIATRGCPRGSSPIRTMQSNYKKKKKKRKENSHEVLSNLILCWVAFTVVLRLIRPVVSRTGHTCYSRMLKPPQTCMENSEKWRGGPSGFVSNSLFSVLLPSVFRKPLRALCLSPLSHQVQPLAPPPPCHCDSH